MPTIKLVPSATLPGPHRIGWGHMVVAKWPQVCASGLTLR